MKKIGKSVKVNIISDGLHLSLSKIPIFLIIQKQLGIQSLFAFASFLSGPCNKVLETLLHSYKKP